MLYDLPLSKIDVLAASCDVAKENRTRQELLVLLVVMGMMSCMKCVPVLRAPSTGYRYDAEI
jgi:hypothetical protein